MKFLPFTPVSLSRAEVTAFNALFQSRGKRRFPLGGQVCELALCPRVEPFQPRLEVSLRCGELDFYIGLEQDIFSDAPAGFMVPGDGDDLPEAVRIALLEAVFEEALDGLAIVLGKPVSLLHVRDAGDAGLSSGHPCLSFALIRQKDGLRSRGYVGTLDPRYAPAVLDLLARSARAAGPIGPTGAAGHESLLDLAHLPMTVVPVIGRSRITGEELAGLAMDDVILVEEYFSEETPRWYLGPSLALGVEIREGRGTVTTIITDTANITNITEATMQAPSQAVREEAEDRRPEASETAGDAPRLNLENLDIEVRFELGREVMTLGELQKLAPGQIFELRGPIHSPVTITANSRPVARGEVVDIEGRVGVRVLEILPGVGMKAERVERFADLDGKDEKVLGKTLMEDRS